LISIFEKSIYDLSNIKAQLAGPHLTDLDKLYRPLDFYTAKVFADGASTYVMLQEQLLRSIKRSTQLLEEITEKQFGVFEVIVKSGIAKGVFKPEVNIRMVFYTVLATVRHIVIVHRNLWLQEDSENFIQRFQQDVDEANAYLKSLLSQMLLCEAQPASAKIYAIK